MSSRSSLPHRLLDSAAALAARALDVADRRTQCPPRRLTPDVRVDPADMPYYRREMFPNAGPLPWLDRPDALELIDSALAAGGLTDTLAQLARRWVRDGYVVLPSFFEHSRIDAAWQAYEVALAAGTFAPAPPSGDDPFPGRTLDPHLRLAKFDELLRDERMLAIVGTLLGTQPVPFQTIASHTGSEQGAHSDSIHMTTYPLGFLVANWIAFEDIEPDSGPLFVYPGSHRLPYCLSADVDIPLATSGERTDYSQYHAKYEPAIAAAIAAAGLEPTYYTAGAGDVMIWHANLIHGGSPRRTLGRSRKALVGHYFAAGAFTYHDYTGTPTRLERARMNNRNRPRYIALDTILRALESSLASRGSERAAVGEKYRLLR